jgi:hypothetical protein
LSSVERRGLASALLQRPTSWHDRKGFQGD